MYPMLHIGPYPFYSFGLVFGCAICLGWFTVTRYLRTHGIVVNEAVLGACIIGFGFLGAKLDYAVMYGLLLSHGQHHPWPLMNLRGGYTYLGCIVLGSAAAGVYAWTNRLPMLRFFDGIFCIGLSYAVGRLGCFLAGDGDYGISSNLPWAMSFPHGIVPTIARVHPTMLYSSIWEFAVFAILWRLSNPRRQPPLRPGALFATYLIASGAGRFLVEFLSRNPSIAFGLKEAQLVSLAMMAGGMLVLARVLLHARPEKFALFVVAPVVKAPKKCHQGKTSHHDGNDYVQLSLVKAPDGSGAFTSVTNSVPLRRPAR